MKVLIVEDEDPKLRHLTEFLGETYPLADFEIARSANSALEAIEDHEFDLILLDMSIPTFDIGEGEGGGRPQGFGGTDILRFVKVEDLSVNVVVVTGYDAFEKKGGERMGIDDLKESLTAEFPRNFIDIIYFNTTYDGWKMSLVGIVEKLDLL